MDAAKQGFLIVYEFEDDDRPLIVEDDGRVCYAHVRGPTGNVVCHAWLYNRLAPPNDADPNSLAWHAAPLQSVHVRSRLDRNGPLPASAADLRASLIRATNKPTIFNLFIRNELVATLDAERGGDPNWQTGTVRWLSASRRRGKYVASHRPVLAAGRKLQRRERLPAHVRPGAGA